MNNQHSIEMESERNGWLGPLHSVAIPDLVTPAQWQILNRNLDRSPEKRLLLAILEDAINCWLQDGLTGRKARVKAEATEWLFSDNDALFGFKSVCEHLEIDPAYFRARLRQSAAAPRRCRRSHSGRKASVSAIRER